VWRRKEEGAGLSMVRHLWAQMDTAVWDYIFLRGEYPADCEIEVSKLDQMKREFEYWYSVDLRVSGRDLIGNHLTMFLYNHAAIFPEEEMLKSIFANGFIKINEEKMSKSTGNFLTIEDAIAEYSADAVRLSMCDAGDSLEDANFKVETANSAIMRFHSLIDSANKYFTQKSVDMREGPCDQFADRIFFSQLNEFIKKTDDAYSKMLFRQVAKNACYDMESAFGDYRVNCGSTLMHKSLVEMFFETTSILMSPITPHVCEQVWEIIGKSGSVTNARFPAINSNEIDCESLRSWNYIQSLVEDIRSKIVKEGASRAKKAGTTGIVQPQNILIYVADDYLDWQKQSLAELANIHASTGTLPEGAQFAKLLSQNAQLKKEVKKVMSFFSEIVRPNFEMHGVEALDTKLKFNELKALQEHSEFVRTLVNVPKICVHSVFDASVADVGKQKGLAIPTMPTFALVW